MPKKQPAAESPGAALVRKRWEKTTAEQRSKHASELASRITPEAAKARAEKAAITRRKNAKKTKPKK